MDSVVRTVIRSDWDLAQIGCYSPQCLWGQASTRALDNLMSTIDPRASGAVDLLAYKSDYSSPLITFVPLEPIVEDVVKLVAPVEAVQFSQTGNGPDTLIFPASYTAAELYNFLRNRRLYGY
jgi:hypothetical protein